MSVLNELLSTLPFMTEARAALVINAFADGESGFYIRFRWPSFLFSRPHYCRGRGAAAGGADGGWLHKRATASVKFYVSAIRGTPMLVQLMIVFYGLPAIGIRLDPLPRPLWAFRSQYRRLCLGNHTRGDFVGAQRAVGSDFSIGVTYMQTFRRIIMPRAFRVSGAALEQPALSACLRYLARFCGDHYRAFPRGAANCQCQLSFLPVYIEAGLVYWVFCFSSLTSPSRVSKNVSTAMWRNKEPAMIKIRNIHKAFDGKPNFARR